MDRQTAVIILHILNILRTILLSSVYGNQRMELFHALDQVTEDMKKLKAALKE